VDFELSAEEALFATSIRRYALERLAPEYATWDRGTALPRERFVEAGTLGITGLRVPAVYGGTEASFVMVGLAAEEISRGDFNYSLIIQLSAIAADLLAAHASDAVRARWLPGLAAGQAVVAFGLTEPAAGSDAANLAASARRDGDQFVLSGEKASVTFAGSADASIVFARTGGAGAAGISAFLVPLDLPGVARQVYRSPGERLTQRGSLFFDHVRIPAGHLLGAEGAGFRQAMGAFDYNRAVIGLACLGAAAQSLDETIAWVRERRTFGQPLARHEAVAFQIAEHLTAVEAARLLAYRCLWKRDRGEPHTMEAAMAKWLGPKVAVEAIHACLLLHGHYGYSMDVPLEQRLRDVIGLEIGDGTPEIMKGVIAREAIGREYVSYR
jgi:cyclohexanecarboxyl-CoA dehydrogenase